MAISLITERACCCIPLRTACVCIAGFYLVSTVLTVILKPRYLTHGTYIAGFIIILCGNAGLLFGALREKKWFLCVWLVAAMFFFIGWPIAVLGIIFNYGDYRASASSDNVFFMLVQYIFILGMYSYCTSIVWSYFNQLKNKDSSQPPRGDVV